MLVLYGVRLGVALPHDRTEAQYTPRERWQEIRTAQQRGIVAAGLVKFVNR